MNSSDETLTNSTPHTRYSSDIGEIDNPFIHLTNVAIQKHNEDYNSSHGGKWHIRDLRTYLEATRGVEDTELLFSQMNRLIIHSLLACQNVIINDRHCFECYGYDLLIDDDLKAWLVEVNASPSLTTTTESDRMLKQGLIRDVYRIVVPQESWTDWKGAVHSGPCKDEGAFRVLYDEAAEEEAKNAAKANGGSGKGGGGGGGGGEAAAALLRRPRRDEHGTLV